MARKTFLLIAAIFFLLNAAAVEAKEKEFPIEQRVKIFVEVEDFTNFEELATDHRLRGMLVEKLSEQNIFYVIKRDEDDHEESIFNAKTLGDQKDLADVGDLIIFPQPAEKIFDETAQEIYKGLGADYVLRCKIFGLGMEQKIDSYGYYPGFGIGIGIGNSRHNRFGVGVGFDVNTPARKRNYFCAVIQMQLISVNSRKTLWRSNLVGQSVRHDKPSKGYDSAVDEAYLKALQEATKNIVKRVTEHAKKFLIPKVDLTKETDSAKKTDLTKETDSTKETVTVKK